MNINIELTDTQVASIIKQWFLDNVHREAKYRDNEAGRIIKHFITEDGNWKNKARGKKFISTTPNKNILSSLISKEDPKVAPSETEL